MKLLAIITMIWLFMNSTQFSYYDWQWWLFCVLMALLIMQPYHLESKHESEVKHE